MTATHKPLPKNPQPNRAPHSSHFSHSSCSSCPSWLKPLFLAIFLLTLPLLAACARSADPAGPDAWRAALQPPLDAALAPSLATSPTLHLALTLALERSPVLAAGREHWRAAIERLPQSTSLPDPMLGFEAEAPTLGALSDPLRYQIGLNQTIPWWGKLRTMGRVAAVDAEIAHLRHEIVAREVFTDVKDAWYELYYIDRAAEITARIERLLLDQATLAYGATADGRAVLAEGFRAESQAAQLGYDRQLLADQRVAQAERLRALLNLPPDTPIGPVRTAPVYAVEQDLATLQSLAETWTEVLKIAGLEIERAEHEAHLARLARIPDFSLGMNWMNIRPGDGRGRGDNYEPMAGFNLPIWEQRNRALVRERDAMRRAAGLQALDQANMTRQAVAQAWFDVRLTGRLEELYEQTLLPQAEAVMRQAEAWYRADLGSFSNVLESTLAWHNFLLARLRARADHGQSIDRLERVLGTVAMIDQVDAPTNAEEAAR
jgi:outer membrane protein TolC